MPKRSFVPPGGDDRHGGDGQDHGADRYGGEQYGGEQHGADRYGGEQSVARPRLPVHADPPTGPIALRSAAELTDGSVVRQRPSAPRSGWRRLLFRAGAGAVLAGGGPVEHARRDQEARIRRVLTAPHRVAVVSLKGGVGKTTVTAVVGLMLSELRGDRVAVLDADPDGGTLADRLSGESTVSVRDLAARADAVHALPDLAEFTSLSGRLQVVASDQNPARDDALDGAGYQRAAAALARFSDIVITDSGTGMVHSAVRATLATADSLVVVGSQTVDGASRAGRTLDWLVAHGYHAAAARAVVVLSADRSSPDVDPALLREHFARRCRAVVELPRDPHLTAGGRIRLAALRPETSAAVTEIAALLADEFGRVRPGTIADC